MRVRHRGTGLLFMWLLWLSQACVGQINVMSYNLRYDNAGDGENAWGERRTEVVSMLQRYHPDVLGVQEALHEQAVYLSEHLRGYDRVGVGRDDGKQAGEYCAIYVDTTRFIIVSSRTYWLSETPDTVSVGWDAAMERIVTTVVLKDRGTLDTLFVLNAHFDHIGEMARLNSAKLIIGMIRDLDLRNDKVVFMGDLNAEPTSAVVSTLSTLFRDAREHCTGAITGPECTFNGFSTTPPCSKRIDYIFSLNLSSQRFTTVDERRKNGLQLSDHYAVMSELR